MKSKELNNIDLSSALGVRKVADYFKVKWHLVDEKMNMFTLKRPGIFNILQDIRIKKFKNFLNRELPLGKGWSIRYID